jgi:hypothetical protein
MPIPLGILAVAGAGGGAGVPAYEQIATAFGTGSSDTISFSSIPSTYKHLQIRGVSNDASGSASLQMRLNSVTTSAYRWHRMYGQSGSVTSQNSGVATDSINITGPSSPTSNIYGALIVDILDYANTSKNKTVRSLSGNYNTGTTPIIALGSGLWMDTAAISAISFTTFGGGFATPTRFSLYGIKG